MIFQPDHIEQIKAGEKTATRRDWDSKQVTVGKTYRACTDLFTSRDDCDCFIRVTDVYRQALGEMTLADVRAEGEYESMDAFRATWRSINGPESWVPSRIVWVVEFEYAGETDPRV